MALKSLYRVCEILILDLIFSSFSVRSQNHSYKNSIVFRLTRHLCSSTSLVCLRVHVFKCICVFVCLDSQFGGPDSDQSEDDARLCLPAAQ